MAKYIVGIIGIMFNIVVMNIDATLVIPVATVRSRIKGATETNDTNQDNWFIDPHTACLVLVCTDYTSGGPT